MFKHILDSKENLINFIFGGIFWSILYIIISFLRLAVLYSQGKLILP